MPNKSVKCQKCGRAFGTPNAMKQHKAHCKVGAKAVANVRAGSAPVSMAARVVETGTDSATVSGVDRLAHVADVSQHAHGSVVFDEVISSGSFARLSQMAAAYQKIRYRKLVVRVVPMMATSVNGGYVAAFVRDPADRPPPTGDKLLSWITSQKGSVTTKWWQTSTISVPVSDRTYYTSTSEEVREYSPGRVVIVADGKASTEGPMTVFVDWAVTLNHASMEIAVDPGRPDTTTVKANIWAKSGSSYPYTYQSDSKAVPDPKYMFTDFEVGDSFLLPCSVTIDFFKSGESGDTETKNIWVLFVESATGVRYRVHPDTSTSIGNSAADGDLIVPRGTVLRRIETPKSVSGEACLPHPRLVSGISSGLPSHSVGLQSLESLASSSKPPTSSEESCLRSTKPLATKSPSGTQLELAQELSNLVLESFKSLLKEQLPALLTSQSLPQRGFDIESLPSSLGDDDDPSDGVAQRRDL